MTELFSFKTKTGDLIISVRSNIEPPLIWLSEFLHGSFEKCSPDDELNFEIIYLIDSEKYSGYVDSLPRVEDGITEMFTMDKISITLPVYHVDQDKIVFDHEHNLIYVLSKQTGSFSIVTLEDNVHSRVALMRSARQLTMIYFWQRDSLIIHGAALAFRDKGIIISGRKGAGKTSLLINLLHNKCYEYIANDRLIIKPDNTHYSIYGIPTIVNIGDSTLSSLQTFREKVRYEHGKYFLTINEKNKIADKTRKTDPSGNYTLSPLHFCNLLNVKMCYNSRLSLIIFANAKNNGKQLDILPLSSYDAAEKLYENNFGKESGQYLKNFFTISDNKIPNTRNDNLELCNDITLNTTCFNLTFNINNLDFRFLHNELFAKLLVN